jgi:phosphoenolpyruvate-protein kinase (PTS system EI component)
VSREFAIPAVVGTSDATRRINTGDRVRVNGSTGQVFILSTAGKPGVHKPARESLLHT